MDSSFDGLEGLAPVPDGSPQIRRITIAAVAIITLLGTIGSALSPWLLVRMPLALVALSPDVRHIVLVAANAEFLPVLAISEPRRVAGLFAMYGLGWCYGPMALVYFEQKAPRLGGALRWAERLFERFGALLLVVFPAYTFGAFAGAARTPLRIFVPAMLLGQAIYISTSYYFGGVIRQWTVPFVGFLREHLVVSTLICVALVAGSQLWSRLKRRRAAE